MGRLGSLMAKNQPGTPKSTLNAKNGLKGHSFYSVAFKA